MIASDWGLFYWEKGKRQKAKSKLKAYVEGTKIKPVKFSL